MADARLQRNDERPQLSFSFRYPRTAIADVTLRIVTGFKS
jgi:hypothetical protein